MSDIDSFMQAVIAMRYQVPVGTKGNPYKVIMPKWFAQRCDAEGTTPQQVYDRVFSSGPYRNGRVEIAE